MMTKETAAVSMLKICLLFLVVSFCVYFNSLSGEFIGDDILLIADNPYVQTHSVDTLDAIFKNTFFSKQITDGDAYYRPGTILSYFFDSLWTGLNPVGYHVTNILLHAFSSFLFFYLMVLLGQSRRFSLVVALIFCVHPIQSAHIAALSGRTDLLCLMFLLSTLIFYKKAYGEAQTSLRKNFYMLFSLGTFLCALLSKETAIVFPVILFSHDLLFKGKRKTLKNIPTYGTYIGFIFLYIIVRNTVVGIDVSSHLYDGIFSEKIWTRILTANLIFLEHIKILFYPVHLYFWWRYIPYVTDSWGIAWWLFLGTVGSISFLLWYARRSAVALFGFIWMVVFYFPVSNLIPVWSSLAPYSMFVGKQFFHIPFLGFCLFLFSLLHTIIESFPHTQKKVVYSNARIIFLPILFLLCMQTLMHNTFWGSSDFYYKEILRNDTQNIEARIDLAFKYIKHKRYNTAVRLLKEAIDLQETKNNSIRPTASAYQYLCDIYRSQGYSIDAIRAICKKGLLHFPSDTALNHFMAVLAFEEEKIEEARFYAKKALLHEPTKAATQRLMKDILGKYTLFKEKEHKYKARIEKDPNDAAAYERLGSLYRIFVLYDTAISFYKKALALQPDMYHARSNMAFCYEKLLCQKQAAEERAKIGDPSIPYCKNKCVDSSDLLQKR